MKKLRIVEDHLENLKNVSSQAELMDSMGKFNNSALELMAQAAKRQHELMDPALRDDLAGEEHQYYMYYVCKMHTLFSAFDLNNSVHSLCKLFKFFIQKIQPFFTKVVLHWFNMKSLTII